MLNSPIVQKFTSANYLCWLTGYRFTYCLDYAGICIVYFQASNQSFPVLVVESPTCITSKSWCMRNPRKLLWLLLLLLLLILQHNICHSTANSITKPRLAMINSTKPMSTKTNHTNKTL